MVRLITDLTARVVIITAIYSAISYFLVQRYGLLLFATLDIPVLFVMYGIVVLISVLFDLWRYHVMSAMPVKAKLGVLDHTRLITDFTIRVVSATWGGMNNDRGVAL